MPNEKVDSGTKSVLRVLDAGLDDVGKGMARDDEKGFRIRTARI